MKRLYKEPKLIVETLGISKTVMLITSETPADPDKPVLGKDRDDFDEEIEAIEAAADTNNVWNNNSLW